MNTRVENPDETMRSGREPLTLLLSSVGRRPYLVEWFREALDMNGVRGRVIAADSDQYAPSRSFADDFVAAPPVADAGYERWLVSVLDDEEIDLAVSINDFELSRWSSLSPQFAFGERLLRLAPDVQTRVEDKLEMGLLLGAHGVHVPATLTAATAVEHIDGQANRELVTKGRFGSASRGLRHTVPAALAKAVQDAAHEVTDASGRDAALSSVDPLELVVVQDRVRGQEFGVDVISDFDGRYVTSLVRRKVAMRFGETERAESVRSEPFIELGRRIASAIPHRGSIDVDVIVDKAGAPWVIDVNPRFGGGYPFSHLSGAHIPAAYVAWLTGSEPDPGWLTCVPGIVSSKYVGVSRTA